ncbi:CpsD/CapB family tyrosine-protein kinase [Agrilactobacillus yilanensis]|uniref:CpsD/CapB family tyrosine-protein kinase n=1 Tax=Agrilactobacillus yilanensis TaxID=2485997 RepID=A0ABW4J7Y4_9LACO|nr:CpsD/CapB family tyrosine-protein kinase [Agrilactobacillus yilanensis]
MCAKVTKQQPLSGVQLVTILEPTATISEQFRTIRTNIQFSQVAQKLTVIMITSAKKSEGKSTVSANLAVTWANQGQSTLLVDADLRRPTVHKTFQLSNQYGLTSLLTTDNTLDYTATMQATMVENLYVMPSGPIPPNPSELLNTSRMNQVIADLKQNFDFVIFDVPPVGVVSDAQIMGTKVDGTVLVVPQGIALKNSVVQAKAALENVHAKILGVVMNRVNSTEDKYYGGYYGSDS